MLDLFSGKWGWSKAFAPRGWECVGVDLVDPGAVPDSCRFWREDVMALDAKWDLKDFDFVCASSPCEEFSVFGMKCFHPNPKYPAIGIKLFNHTRQLCESSGVPYVMENVRSAQQFVGQAVNHCGPFYLWGTGVPAILPQGITKGTNFKPGPDRKFNDPTWNGSKSKAREAATAKFATIPPELANCVADYAERICGQALLTGE